MTNFSKDDAEFRREFIALKTELLTDVSKCLELVKKSGSQFDRRNLVRSSFAAIEGLTWALKAAALRIHEIGRVEFDQGEMALLSERTFELEDDGKVRLRFARLQLKSNIRFAVKAFAKANAVEAKLDCGGVGWAAFREAKAIRDRLVHPKNAADLTVSDAEVNVLDRALTWWARELSRLFVATKT
jgi:hypothetical protein